MGSLSFFSHRVSLVSHVLLLVFTCLYSANSQTLATTVPLLLPSNLAVDSKGNLYVSETGRHMVRRVNLQGEISTVAGTGTQGFDGDGGLATAALLDSPLGLAVDDANLYIADSHNHRIRRVDLTSGIITTVAGGQTAGSTGDGGQAASAMVDLPTAIALDRAGSLYIADARSHRIRRISSSGVIMTVAGAGMQGDAGDTGSAITALLDSPGGLAVDTAGNVYVADTHNHRIRRIDAVTGRITTLAGSSSAGFGGDSGSATAAKLSLPRGLTIDGQGNIFITDYANHRIRRVDGLTGTITTLAGDGVQAFSGDGGPPSAASLNGPSSVSVASEGAVSIADAGNGRVRQIVPGPLLQTVAGLGASASGTLSLSGPTVVSYGTGSIIATLTSSSAAGSVTFFENSSGSPKTLTSVPLQSNTAVLDLSGLGAGQHSITATYAGDQAHAGAQSQQFSLLISPAVLTVTMQPSTVPYGENIPALTGILEGVLRQDQGKLAVALMTNAALLSPVGIYPVVATLSGTAAANYTVASTPSLSIAQAETTTGLSVGGGPFAVGQAVTVTAHVASSTTGVPTGDIAVLDGGNSLVTSLLNAAGDLVVTTSALGAGSHTLTALYGGDRNFRASTSAPTSITVGPPQTNSADFTLASSGAVTQTVAAGSPATFTFIVQPQQGLASQISLSASGLPNLATVAFNPGYIPPGSAATTVALTIATPKTARLEYVGGSITFAALLLGAGLGRRRLRGLTLLAGLLVISGCGDRVYRGSSAQTSRSYTITVTGTATGSGGTAIQHSATVTLVIVSAS
jgi:sugar lactone lactonase YvrE